MSTAHAEHDAQREAAVERLFSALHDLPPAAQDQVQKQLAEAVLSYSEDKDLKPLLHFVDGLLMTARLHRNPRYLKAVSEADADSVNPSKSLDRDGIVALTQRAEQRARER